MAVEDYTTYTEVDPNNHIDLVGTNHIDFESHMDEDAYLYKDKGSGHFTDFEHLIQVEGKSYSGDYSRAGCWIVSNDIDDIKGLIDNSKTFLLVRIQHQTGGGIYIFLNEYHSGSSYEDYYSSAALNTPYYIMLKKVGTSLKMGIYSTAALRAAGDATDGDFDNLALTLQADHKFQHIFAANTANHPLDRHFVVEIENLDLQEVVRIPRYGFTNFQIPGIV